MNKSGSKSSVGKNSALRFRARIKVAGDTAALRIPARVVDALDAGREPTVKATINGYTWSSSIEALNGIYMLEVGSEVCAGAGVSVGETVDVELILDAGPRELNLPPDFTAVLKKDPNAMMFFGSLSDSDKRRIVEPIHAAEAAETRQQRIEKALHDLHDKVWGEWFSTNAFSVDKRQRRFFRLLPHDPRCKFCNAPFEGLGGALVRMAYGKRRSRFNPRFCNLCEEAAQKYSGGTEVEMSMLFADIRGSTPLSSSMSPTDFSRLINRFYRGATRLISDADGLVEKLAGDSVAAFWGAGFAGPDYVRRTVTVAQEMAHWMRRQSIPVGIAVHAAVAFFGAMGGGEGPMDITAVGDEVNLCARVCSQAAAGEVFLTASALERSGLAFSNLGTRTLTLKGIPDPITVRVLPSEV